jgi:hypothetical protein
MACNGFSQSGLWFSHEKTCNYAKDPLTNPLVVMEHINDKAAIDYNAPYYSGCVTVLQPCKAYDDPLLGWGKGATDGVEVQHVSILPASIIVEPFVAGQLKTFPGNTKKRPGNNKAL